MQQKTKRRGPKVIYTEEIKQQVSDLSKIMTLEDIAKRLAVNLETLRRNVSNWRTAGLKVYGQKTPFEGEIRIRQRPHGGPTQFIYDNGKWYMLHIYNYEKVHGPIPKFKYISFEDGNRMNCAIENLVITSVDNYAINSKGQPRGPKANKLSKGTTSNRETAGVSGNWIKP